MNEAISKNINYVGADHQGINEFLLPINRVFKCLSVEQSRQPFARIPVVQDLYCPATSTTIAFGHFPLEVALSIIKTKSFS